MELDQIMLDNFREHREHILGEIKQERQRQLTLWSIKDDDSNTRNDWASYICYYASSGAYNGKGKIFTNMIYRRSLIKVAAICVAAVEAIDRLVNLPATVVESVKNARAGVSAAKDIDPMTLTKVCPACLGVGDFCGDLGSCSLCNGTGRVSVISEVLRTSLQSEIS